MAELTQMMTETYKEALGRTHRPDPVLRGNGGPAGNARLTAWTGLVLFVLLAVEGVTILDIRGLLTWHLVVGVLLIPPALLKTATTGWRIVRYYTGSRPYQAAGPPPMPLRLLGPLVVLSTLAVLGTGLVLILIGPDASRRTLIGTGGRGLDAVMLHKASFLIWIAVTSLHVIGRLVPALRLVGARGARVVPGRAWRGATLVVTMVVAVVLAVVIVGSASPWHIRP